MSDVRTFDPKSVQCIINGIPISGYASDTFIELEMNSDSWGVDVGPDGEVSRFKKNDFTAKLTLTLKQTSPSNNVLSGLWNIDRLSNAGVFPFLLKEIGSGLSVASGAAGWIIKPPPLTFGEENKDRVWPIYIAQCQLFIGGNASLAGV